MCNRCARDFRHRDGSVDGFGFQGYRSRKGVIQMGAVLPSRMARFTTTSMTPPFSAAGR